MKRETRIKVAAVALIVSAVAFLVGCTQPYDSVTGAKVGGHESIFAPHPATNPDTGNAIVLKPVAPSREDIAAGVEAGGKALADKVAPVLPPPWNYILAIVGGAGATLAAGAIRKKKKAQ